MKHSDIYRTIPGGSIDYAYYVERGHIIRSQSAHRGLQNFWAALGGSIFWRLRAKGTGLPPLPQVRPNPSRHHVRRATPHPSVEAQKMYKHF